MLVKYKIKLFFKKSFSYSKRKTKVFLFFLWEKLKKPWKKVWNNLLRYVDLKISALNGKQAYKNMN